MSERKHNGVEGLKTWQHTLNMNINALALWKSKLIGMPRRFPPEGPGENGEKERAGEMKRKREVVWGQITKEQRRWKEGGCSTFSLRSAFSLPATQVQYIRAGGEQGLATRIPLLSNPIFFNEIRCQSLRRMQWKQAKLDHDWGCHSWWEDQ